MLQIQWKKYYKKIGIFAKCCCTCAYHAKSAPKNEVFYDDDVKSRNNIIQIDLGKKNSQASKQTFSQNSRYWYPLELKVDWIFSMGVSRSTTQR